jgi:hypothetical protein
MTIHERITEGIAAISTLPKDSVGTLKEPARALLAEVLGEDIPTHPLRKAERLELLTRAQQALS